MQGFSTLNMTLPHYPLPTSGRRAFGSHLLLGLLLPLLCRNLPVQAATDSIARVWDLRALAAIRVDTPHPPAQARNLLSLSVCMYDAWAAYDPKAIGYVYRGKHTTFDVAAARREAISYAAFQLLKERHAYSRTAQLTLIADDSLMTSLGYSISNRSRDPSTPAGVGNSVYDAVSAWFINDGSRQTNGIPWPEAQPPVAYPNTPASQGGYVFINPPLATALSGINDGHGNTVLDINRWQRLQIVDSVDQNGFPQGPIQGYLGAQWLAVRAFALGRTDSGKLWIDPGPPPYLGTASHAEFISNVVEVIRRSSELTPDDGVTIDASPGASGNNTLGTNDGHGYAVNPFTGQPYAPNIMPRGDFARVLAEYWADGPASETPPGHWNVVANEVTDALGQEKRIGGTGPVVDDLEWDVKLYLSLNAAIHEAACAAWSIKRYYDGWRPISAIRFTAGLGQSSNPSLPSYDAHGLPLVPNLIELVTEGSIESGRHRGLSLGKIAVRSWPGQPTNPATAHQGVHWMLASDWVPYQRTNLVTPAFPGYVSGHSTFSRSAAEILTAFTGSRYFPGGLGTYNFPADIGLGFESGPSQPVQLQWATYYDAADQAGLSRIWGGIHPPVDDFAGRRAGAEAGKAVWALVQKYWDGSVTHLDVAIRRTASGECEVSYTTRRGFKFQPQSSADLNASFASEGSVINQPFDVVSVVQTNRLDAPHGFFQVRAVE